MPAGKKTESTRELAALALASGKTLAEAAEAAGCGLRTLKGWKTEHSFQKQVREIRAAMVDEAVARIAAGMSKAADVLEKLLDSTDEAQRRQAATRLIEFGLQSITLDELRRRVEELENRQPGAAP